MGQIANQMTCELIIKIKDNIKRKNEQRKQARADSDNNKGLRTDIPKDDGELDIK